MDDHIALNDYLYEEHNEIMSWIHLVITECSKRLYQNKKLNTKLVEPTTCKVQIPMNPKKQIHIQKTKNIINFLSYTVAK